MDQRLGDLDFRAKIEKVALPNTCMQVFFSKSQGNYMELNLLK